MNITNMNMNTNVMKINHVQMDIIVLKMNVNKIAEENKYVKKMKYVIMILSIIHITVNIMALDLVKENNTFLV